MPKIQKKTVTKYITTDGEVYDKEEEAITQQILIDLRDRFTKDFPGELAEPAQVNICSVVLGRLEALIAVLEENGLVAGTQKLLRAQDQLHNALCSLESMNPYPQASYQTLIDVCKTLGLSTTHPHVIK